MEANALRFAYGKRCLMLSSTEDESCPALAYSTYWKALGQDEPDGVRILLSKTMSHADLIDRFLEGIRRVDDVAGQEDDVFAEELQRHLTPGS